MRSPVLTALTSAVLYLSVIDTPHCPAQPPNSRSANTDRIEIIPASRMPPDGPRPRVSSVSRPGTRGPADHERPNSSTAPTPSGGFTRDEYERVFQGIPFSRVQFRVNPGYRHDSTMEILTGNPRTQTIVHHQRPVTSTVRPQPSRPARQLPLPQANSFWFGAFPWLTVW